MLTWILNVLYELSYYARGYIVKSQHYDRYHQNSNGEPGVFDLGLGELEEGVFRRFQEWPTTGNICRKRKHSHLWNYDRWRRNSNGKSDIFDLGELDSDATTRDNGKWQYRHFERQFSIFGYPLLSQSLDEAYTFIEFVVCSRAVSGRELQRHWLSSLVIFYCQVLNR